MSRNPCDPAFVPGPPPETAGAALADAPPSAPPPPASAPTLGLDRDDRGQVMVALNLILGRQPDPGEGPLAGLVAGGLFGLTARIDPADPAVPRWRFALMLGETTLASTEAVVPRGALSAMLNQGEARAVLDRLSGLAAPQLRLVAQPADRTVAGQPGMVTLDIRPDRLHAALADPKCTVLDAGALEAGFFHALAAGDIAATPRHDPATLARELAINLPRWLPMLLRPAPQGHVLGRPPVGMTRLTLSVGLSRVDPSPAQQPRALVADLGELLAAAVADSAGADRVLRFSVPQGNGQLATLPPLQRRGEAQATRAIGGRQTMLLAGHTAMTPALSVQPGRKLGALAVPTTMNPSQGALAGMVAAAAVAKGPLIGRIEDGVWPDNADGATSWHVPELLPVPPGPDEADAFRFELRRAGMNIDGRAGLDATITLRLRPRVGAAALAAQASGAKLRAIVPDSVQVALAIPFRDSEGQTRQQLFPAEVAADGDDYRVTVRLIDDWARLAYGALAYEGFQSLAAELREQSAFDGLSRVDPAALSLARLGKLHRLPLRRTSRSGGTAGGATSEGLRDAMMTLAPLAVTMAIRPTLVEATRVPARERPVVVHRRFSVSRTQPLVIPCALHGALYRETTDAGEIAIGCREAFRLGETDLRLYRALPEHGDASLSVFASLTQPGRFLVVPRRYVIGRHPASDGDRALKPTATLYSALDADHADQNLCVLMAALTPDLDPGRLRALAAALTPTNGTPPLLDLPQDVDAEPEFLWSLPDLLQPETTRSRSGFTVQLTAPLSRAPLLRDMMLGGRATGRAILKLPDNSRVETDLSLDLTAIRGPDPDGPVAISLDATGGLTLVNRLDQPLRVTGVSVMTPAGPALLPLNQPLGSGASAQSALALPAGATEPLALTAPLGQAAALSEARSFTEDITGSVVFLNLIDMAAHGLAMMQVSAELPGGGPARTLSFRPDTTTQSADYVLPLTEALAALTVRFTLTRIGTDGQSVTLPPRDLDLTQAGHVVSLTWEDMP